MNQLGIIWRRTIYWQEFLQHNDYDFYANYLAAKVDEDNYKVTPYTPSGDYQAISANSFKALGFTIKLPAAKHSRLNLGQHRVPSFCSVYLEVKENYCINSLMHKIFAH